VEVGKRLFIEMKLFLSKNYGSFIESLETKLVETVEPNRKSVLLVNLAAAQYGSV
jgi:hypothetical protein